MKATLLGVILLVLSPVFAAESYEEELSAEGVDLLTIEWANGNVELIADGLTSLQIAAVGSRSGATLETSDWLEYTDFGVGAAKAALVFNTGGRATNIAVDLTVRFPRGLRVSVEAGNGDVVVSGGASLTVEAGNGDLNVSEVAGEIDLDAGNGNVELALPSGFAAEVELDAGNGNVELTIGGDFSGEVEINAGNGNVSVTFAEVPDDLRIDAQTGMGSVSTNLPGAEASESFMGGSIIRRGTSCSLEIAAGMGDIDLNVE